MGLAWTGNGVSQTAARVTHARRFAACNGRTMKMIDVPLTPAMRAALMRLDKARSALAQSRRLAQARTTELDAGGSGSSREAPDAIQEGRGDAPGREDTEVGQPAPGEGHPQRQLFDTLTSGRSSGGDH